MKRYLSLLAIAWLTWLATPAVAGGAHGAPANRVDGDAGTYEHASEAVGGAALWETLAGLLGNAAAGQVQPAAMWMGSGYTSGYAVSGRTCKLLERESRLFKSGLDTGIYTPADLSKSSIAEHAKKAGIPRYSPAFWTIATSSLVAANPANVDLPAQKMGEKMYDLCMHKFLGNEITYQ